MAQWSESGIWMRKTRVQIPDSDYWMNLSSVIPGATSPRFVNSQLVCLLPAAIPNWERGILTWHWKAPLGEFSFLFLVSFTYLRGFSASVTKKLKEINKGNKVKRLKIYITSSFCLERKCYENTSYIVWSWSVESRIWNLHSTCLVSCVGDLILLIHSLRSVSNANFSYVPNSMQIKWYEPKQKIGVVRNEFGTVHMWDSEFKTDLRSFTPHLWDVERVDVVTRNLGIMIKQWSRHLRYLQMPDSYFVMHCCFWFVSCQRRRCSVKTFDIGWSEFGEMSPLVIRNQSLKLALLLLMALMIDFRLSI